MTGYAEALVRALTDLRFMLARPLLRRKLSVVLDLVNQILMVGIGPILLHYVLQVEYLTLELGGDEVLLLCFYILQEVLGPLGASEVLVNVLDILLQICQPFVFVGQGYALELSCWLLPPLSLLRAEADIFVPLAVDLRHAPDILLLCAGLLGASAPATVCSCKAVANRAILTWSGAVV